METNNTTKTVEIEDEISKCEELNELKNIVNKYSDSFLEWKKYINSLMVNFGLSYHSLAEHCGLSRNTVKAWSKEGKLPRSRNCFLKLGLGLRMDVAEMNYLLQHYGRYQMLYPKAIEDAICIYVIKHYDLCEEMIPYDYYSSLRQAFTADMLVKNNRSLDKPKKGKDTEDVMIRLSAVQNLEDFRVFVAENESEFMESNRKLLTFLDTYMKIENPTMKRGNTYGYGTLTGDKKLEAIFSQMMSRLRHWGEIPGRMRLIALGIHLHFSYIEMNLMLHYANMAPLCVKDKLESILVYALTQLNLAHPEIEKEHAEELKKYLVSSDFQPSEEHIKEYLQIYESLSEGATDEGITEEFDYYIRNIICDLETEEAQELLSLLPE